MEGNNEVKMTPLRPHLVKGRIEDLSVIKLCLSIFGCILFFFAQSIVHASPFKVPEKLIYDLTWAGIKAGTASLELKNDGEITRIISTAHSAQWISIFYTVDDRVQSTLSNNPSPLGQPLSYRIKLREGRHRRDKEVIFDRSQNKATYINHISNEKKEVDLCEDVFDPLSAFYYLRTLTLIPGKSVYVSIFDSKKVWNVEVKVLRRERVSLPVGTFDTVVVKPLMKSEGIFYRKGEILIWLTDDANHIPIRMQTKVAVGHVNATLVSGID
jgi:hypothetical protein